jgi:predicted phage tail protein
MTKDLVDVRLFGVLGDEVGHNWKLAVKNLSEAMRFIEMNTKKLYKTLYNFDKKNIKYEVIINGRKFKSDKELTVENLEDVYGSELMINYGDLKTIDIIPVLEGADSDAFQLILGVILIIVGLVFPYVSAIAIPAGIALIASGVIGLLSSPPKFDDFREIDQGGKVSYLFSGPANIVGEGGPVPVGYGRAIIGSQVISAAYVIVDYDVNDPSSTIRNEYGGLIPRKPPQQK